RFIFSASLVHLGSMVPCHREARVLLASCLCFCSESASAESYSPSLHDALPISGLRRGRRGGCGGPGPDRTAPSRTTSTGGCRRRSEEHTSELQSRENLVCRLLLEKKQGC